MLSVLVTCGPRATPPSVVARRVAIAHPVVIDAAAAVALWLTLLRSLRSRRCAGARHHTRPIARG